MEVEQDKKSNYDMIQEAIEYITSVDQDFVSEEWMEEHQNFFITIRGEFPDFSSVNEDILDLNFRNKAARAEVLARKVEKARYFDVISYCELCKLCYELYQYCEDVDADDDALVNAFGNMNVTKK
jgi:hypothetical protein